MSNTTVPISEWCKEIRVALARKEMNLQSVADEIGYSYTTITALISGRIVKDNYLDIAKKINEVLEVNVLPEKPQLPSDEWCGAVRAKLYKPVNNTVSGIEKGDFYCYEVKSSVEDFRSGHGLNFLGDYNYLVMPEKIYATISLEVPHYVGVYVLDGTELTCIKKAKRHDRSRPVSEMLLMMFRSAARDRRRICSEITQE